MEFRIVQYHPHHSPQTGNGTYIRADDVWQALNQLTADTLKVTVEIWSGPEKGAYLGVYERSQAGSGWVMLGNAPHWLESDVPAAISEMMNIFVDRMGVEEAVKLAQRGGLPVTLGKSLYGDLFWSLKK